MFPTFWVQKASNKETAQNDSIHTVDGSEIRRSPLEVGSSSHYLQFLFYIPGGAGFLPSLIYQGLQASYEAIPTKGDQKSVFFFLVTSRLDRASDWIPNLKTALEFFGGLQY